MLVFSLLLLVACKSGPEELEMKYDSNSLDKQKVKLNSVLNLEDRQYITYYTILYKRRGKPLDGTSYKEILKRAKREFKSLEELKQEYNKARKEATHNP